MSVFDVMNHPAVKLALANAKDRQVRIPPSAMERITRETGYTREGLSRVIGSPVVVQDVRNARPEEGRHLLVCQPWHDGDEIPKGAEVSECMVAEPMGRHKVIHVRGVPEFVLICCTDCLARVGEMNA